MEPFFWQSPGKELPDRRLPDLGRDDQRRHQAGGRKPLRGAVGKAVEEDGAPQEVLTVHENVQDDVEKDPAEVAEQRAGRGQARDSRARTPRSSQEWSGRTAHW